jgi:hypothetical protein
MNPLQQIAKLMHKHHARLIVETRNDQPEIVLSIPAMNKPDGQVIFAYATDYRLGREFPQYPPQTPLLAEDDLKI